MSQAFRRRATIVVALAVGLTVGLLGPTAAQAGTPRVAAVVAQGVGCGTAIRPCVSLKDVVCWENNWCRVPVTVSPVTAAPIRIEFATSDGTARAGLNYEPGRGVITIEARSTGADVALFMASSRTPTGEPAYLFLTLSGPTGGLLIADTATITIVPRSGTGAVAS
jgi:hypothetical protein